MPFLLNIMNHLYLFIIIILLVCNTLSNILLWIRQFMIDKRLDDQETEIKHPLYDKILELECEKFGESIGRKWAKQALKDQFTDKERTHSTPRK